MGSINRKDLCNYRLSQAEQCLKTAKDLIGLGDYKAAANRSYYCIYHSIKKCDCFGGY